MAAELEGDGPGVWSDELGSVKVETLGVAGHARQVEFVERGLRGLAAKREVGLEYPEPDRV